MRTRFLVALALTIVGCSKGQMSTASAPAASAIAEPAVTGSAASAAAPAPAAPPAVGAALVGGFRGSIDKTHAIVVHLKNAADAGTSSLVGYYFYPPAIDDLTLRGTVLPDGAVHLDESVDGKPTGAFDGHADGHGGVDGTWSDPKKKKSLPFHLDRVQPTAAGSAVIVERHRASKTKSTKPYDTSMYTADPVCDDDVTFVDIVGAIASPADEIRRNTELRPDGPLGGGCDEPNMISSTVEIHTNAGGVLALAQSSSLFQPGMPGASHGFSYTNLALPSGTYIAASDVFTPAGLALIDKKLLASLPSDLDPDIRADVKSHLEANDWSDFVLEKDGVTAWTGGSTPMTMLGIGLTPVKIARKDLDKLRVHPSPLDGLWTSP